MRAFERVYIGYFVYVALAASVLRPAVALRAWAMAAGAGCIIFLLARLSRRSENFDDIRHWMALLFTLMAYREMDLFTPLTRDYHFERRWIMQDQRLLESLGLRVAIESLGPLLPGYLEFCYLLVYGTGAFAIGLFYYFNRRDRLDSWLVVYATGTLLSYALFPYFPSDPPRVVFPHLAEPLVTTVFREVNLFLVGNYGIHSSVFPSAHVSSAFAAAWGLFRFLPEKPWAGRGMLIYAVSVAIATVYGRYHYAADAAAGAGIGLIALAVSLRMKRTA